MAEYSKQPSTKDTWLEEGLPTSNRAIYSYVILYDKSNDRRRGIINFDISDFVGLSGDITSAKLHLYYYNYYLNDPSGGRVDVSKLTRDDWVEDQATWNIYKTDNNWTSAGGDWTESSPGGANTTIPASYGWIEWDITNIVKDAIDNVSKSVNLMVKFNDETKTTNYFHPYFYSVRETTQTTLRPKLVIDYTAETFETQDEVQLSEEIQFDIIQPVIFQAQDNLELSDEVQFDIITPVRFEISDSLELEDSRDVIVRALWRYKDKPTTNWEYKDKPTTNWDYKDKPTTSWTFKDK